MSERIRGALRNALYKSTNLLYFTLLRSQEDEVMGEGIGRHVAIQQGVMSNVASSARYTITVSCTLP